MSYEEVLSYLYSRLPMFHRIGAAAYKADLSNTIALCDRLGNPQHDFKSIHIAGTNGKGSTSHMIASVLMAAGYKVGLYTSPHLKDFRERIKINGKEIPRSYVMRFVEEYKQDFERIEPSFFEWTVALCFDYFSKQKVDIAVIETGLGGRLDSTNVINPLVSVITNIGFDHMDLLGDTLEKIAAEKAGIIKPHTPVVIGESQASIKPIFEQKALENKAQLFYADELLYIERAEMKNRRFEMDIYQHNTPLYRDLQLDLLGDYQKKNVLTVLQALKLLQGRGYLYSEKQMYYGLKYAAKNTRLMGRWEVLKRKPLVVCDTAHNAHGLEIVMNQIAKTPYNKLHIVLGMVKDKDISTALALFPKQATYYFCHADMPRALPAEEMKHAAASFGLQGESYTSVKEAYAAAEANAGEQDFIYIGGSTFIVAEAI